MQKGIKAQFGRVWSVEALRYKDYWAVTDALRIGESRESESLGVWE